MCAMCDDPQSTLEDVDAALRQQIEHHGFTVQYVEADDHHPPFAYTIGLTDVGVAEFLVTALEVDEAADVLGRAAAHALASDDPVLPGEMVIWNDGTAFEFVEVKVPDAHLLTACRFYGPTVRGLQMVRSDERGRFPWEGEHTPRGRWRQYVLGDRTPRDQAAP